MVITIKFDQRLVVTSAIYLCLALGVIFLTYPYFTIYLPSDSSDLASWVQAIGSISAIVAAAVIARADGEHRKQQQTSLENNDRKIAKYYLDKSAVLLELRSFLNKCSHFESIYTNKKLPPHLIEFKSLFFMKMTTDSYLNLRNSVEKLDDAMRERILTGITSEVFNRIDDYVGYLDLNFMIFEDFAKKYKNFHANKNIFAPLPVAEIEKMRALERHVYDSAEIAISLIAPLSSCLSEINEILKFR